LLTVKASSANGYVIGRGLILTTIAGSFARHGQVAPLSVAVNPFDGETEILNTWK
jgi:hypothetical protein